VLYRSLVLVWLTHHQVGRGRIPGNPGDRERCLPSARITERLKEMMTLIKGAGTTASARRFMGSGPQMFSDSIEKA